MEIKNKDVHHKFIVTEKGSLGLLALGDIGLREWRKVKKAQKDDALNAENERDE